MRRMRRDDGVTLVEAALVLPILFMLMFGLVDLGMWSFNVNQASNAARDGARAGILAYPLPGVESIAVEEARARETVVSAVKSNLTGGTVEDDDITIACFADDGTSVACSSADPEPERIRVDVEWHWDLVTPVASVIGIERGAARGDATMAIVGRPVATPAPTPDDSDDPLNPEPEADCVITGLTGPTMVQTSGNQLAQPMEIRFTDNSEGCNDLRVVLTGTRFSNPDSVVHYCGCGEGPDHVWVYTGSNNIWYKNSGKQGTVTLMNGDVPVPGATYQFHLS